MNRKLLLTSLIVVALSMATFTFSLVVARGHTSDNTAAIKSACVQVQKLEKVIRVVLQQSLRTFGQKGTPGYSYYRAHPAEFAAGQLALRQEIAQFYSRAC